MGCDGDSNALYIAMNISIHAARVGCDSCQYQKDRQKQNDFNPRSPSGLRQLPHLKEHPREIISIHAARVGCDPTSMPVLHSSAISIHAARVGCDSTVLKSSPLLLLFQSTQPEWAATLCCLQISNAVPISIHAARVGCDTKQVANLHL